MGFTLPPTASSAQPGVDDTAVVATDHVRAAAARVVTPRGTAQAVSPTTVTGALSTETAQQLAESRNAQPQMRPDVRTQSSSPDEGHSGPVSFEGLNEGNSGSRPPDTHGAVGLKHFVEVTNGTGFGVFNKSDGANVLTVSLASFFGYTTTTIFDPRVVFDKKFNRWVVIAEARPEANPSIQNVFLAVSRTSDPTGEFFVYQFDLPEGNDFFDYPQLGLNRNAVIVTGSVFNQAQTAYLRSRAFGIAKEDLYNGLPFSVPYFDLGAPGTVAPPMVEDNNTDAFLLAAAVTSPNALKLFRARSLGGSDAAIDPATNVPVPAFAVPPAARQPGSTDRLDALNARFQNVSTQIGNQLLNVHTIATGSFPTPKWYQINTTTSTVPPGRSGMVFEANDSDDFNPSVAGSSVGGTKSNPIGLMYFTWSSTNAVGRSQHQARVKGAGRFADDDVNVTGGLTFGEATVPYNPSANTVERWGDYSAVTIDPVAGHKCHVGENAWLVNERQTSSNLWGSRIGSFGYC
ncbi:hypothetical protein [Streptomyces sp. NPDC056401]|uniref:hypothetical protein n=1 Tax=Streptomyces sp. NPDC056401 TaxID=3345809 RepID=UPI0035DBF5A9